MENSTAEMSMDDGRRSSVSSREELAVPPEALGSPQFRKRHGLKYNYVAGAMYRGIASVDMVVALGRAGMLGFFGAGGLPLDAVDDAVTRIQRALGSDGPYGMNLLSSPQDLELEAKLVDLYLKRGVRCVEASAYMDASLPLVRYRLAGLSQDPGGRLKQTTSVVAKVSRGEVAGKFMRPPPADMVERLLRQGLVTAEQARLGAQVPLAQDVTVEADSGGHTDRGNAYVLLPMVRSLRDRIVREHGYAEPVRVGSAGGIGTPDSVLAALMLGAEYVVTGSINQCTVEAGASDAVKDLLQEIGVHDTDYAPAGDMFEIGAKIQVVKKGLFFAARAQKLHELYLRHESIDHIDAKTRAMVEEKYFKRSFEAVWEETLAYLQRRFPERLPSIERSPKQKMALIFRWYFFHSARLAMSGSDEQRVDYQIHCGPALGAFNEWVKGTALEPWRRRHVDAIGTHLMRESARLLSHRLGGYARASAAGAEQQTGREVYT